MRRSVVQESTGAVHEKENASCMVPMTSRQPTSVVTPPGSFPASGPHNGTRPVSEAQRVRIPCWIAEHPCPNSFVRNLLSALDSVMTKVSPEGIALQLSGTNDVNATDNEPARPTQSQICRASMACIVSA